MIVYFGITDCVDWIVLVVVWFGFGVWVCFGCDVCLEWVFCVRLGFWVGCYFVGVCWMPFFGSVFVCCLCCMGFRLFVFLVLVCVGCFGWVLVVCFGFGWVFGFDLLGDCMVVVGC